MDIEAYNNYKDNILFHISADLFDYCRKYNPLLMEFGNISDLTDILFEYIDLENKFILNDDPSESEEDEFEEY
jgi:hypothetical protein